MSKVTYGRDCWMAMCQDGVWRSLGPVSSLNISHGMCNGGEFSARGYISEDGELPEFASKSVAINGGGVSKFAPAGGYKLTTNQEESMETKLNVYEYVVVLRVTEEQAKSGQKDSLLVGPKVILGKNKQEVERVAIRAVAPEIDITMVEVLVRPFAM